MDRFNDAMHQLTISDDGSYTAYSKEYNEHYHSTKDGALSESLYKHIIPAYSLTQSKEEVHILDICYGLGFNTLATVLYYKEYAPEKKLYIYSPELDSTLIKSLESFNYPKEFEVLREIIEAISRDGFYKDEKLSIEVFLGDAREYVKRFNNHFDIVYQDAFSPSVNPMLWTQEYFTDIRKAMKDDAILTTYSTALRTRLALYENGFYIYLNKGENFRNATLASCRLLSEYEKVDMEHKIHCNPDVEPLRDANR